ncbi:hypothetical protein ADK65_09155 [Streptomyces sp. NRRL B-1140]|uniref:hypothetical protein n=1 Tax=Streptomyces sp. NRRL B-1140 TaxID=1415549 RepID=UPI0006AF5C3D|nr:hypothetical protein [Streptomyces sp. NRRL B-1140]KOX02312.1 hypothetical protein ADK65_09155 [Streptomyces sp. NRRL B-1140]
MQPIARPAPVVATTGPRSPAAWVLAVVVAAVLAVLGLLSPPPGAPGTGASGERRTADRLQHDGTHAAVGHLRHDGTHTAPDHLRHHEARGDDGCDAARVVRAATRHEPAHGDHPAPRGYSGTCDRSTHATQRLLPGPRGPATLRVPASPSRVAQDQGRAPPVSSGT